MNLFSPLNFLSLTSNHTSIMMASSQIAILLKDKRGEGRIEGEEEVPWNCPVDKGELVIEIPENKRVPSTDGKQPHNYRLYAGEHDNVTLYAGPTDISPLHGTEVDYLLPVHPPSARIQQYTRENRMTEIMDIKVGDSVMFKKNQGKSNPIAFVRGKVRHLGTIPENEGIYFGIEITEDQYLGRGTTNGIPHFNCGPKNAIYVAMDKIVKKSTYKSDKDAPSNQQGVPQEKPVISTQPIFSEKSGQRHVSSPAHNTRSRSEAFVQEKKDGSYSRESPGMEPKRDSLWSKGKGVVGRLAQRFTGPLPVTAMVESEVVPPTEDYQFKEGDRVVLQSMREKTITGTVKWVGQVKTSKEVGSIPIKAVGIETDVKIKPDKEFPDLHLCLTGSHGHDLFRVAPNHGRIYLPEQLVVHAKDYTQQQQIDNQQEVKRVKDYGLSVDEYRAQHEILEQANKSRDMDHEGRRQEYIPPDPSIGDEEVLAAGRGKLDQSIYMLGTGQYFPEERIERERQALEEFKEQQGGHQQHHHEEITHGYQVIKEGQLEEKELKGFIQISQFTSSQLSGNGVSADRKQTSQEPSTTPLYQNLIPSQTSGKTNFSKSTPPNLNNPPGRAERCPSPSERLPNLNLPSQPTPSSGPPTQDPSQFAIGSMVYLPTQRGEGLQGVVMWIGTLPEIDGLVAGVELDNPFTGCTDGTWQGRRFFNCPPGRAYFCPITALRLDTRYIYPGQISAEDIQNNAPTFSQSNNTDSNSISQVVSFTMNDLQSLLEEKSRVCEREVPFDEVISMMERAIVKQREQNSIIQQEKNWLSTSFDNLSSRYKEIWELLDKEKEKNAQLQTEMIQLLTDRKEKEKNMILTLSQLQEKYHQLIKTHREHLLEHFQLQLTHDQQEEEYSQLQEVHQQQLKDHQKLQQEASQQEEELSQLQKTHQNKVEEHSQLKQTYQQKLEDHQQLQQTLEQVQKIHLEEKVLLQKKITMIESSWKVSFKELAFTKEEVGRGAWGAVRVAIFREQRVAVKQMHELLINKDTREATLQLLNREINTMAQLRHPNLLQFIGAVLDDPSGNPMIITEIMDTSLRNAYETKQLIPDPSCEPVMLTIIRDVAVGLNYLHCLPDPIIHRDVSSANVLLESKGPHKWKTKISDFGSANKARQAMTRAAGAYVYSAPEALKSVVSAKKAQTTKMDVFSYGVLFCEVMTCRFPDEDIFQDMLQQVHSRSPPLYDLIFSCIKEDPSSRPIMKQVIEHLDSYIKQRPK